VALDIKACINPNLREITRDQFQ